MPSNGDKKLTRSQEAQRERRDYIAGCFFRGVSLRTVFRSTRDRFGVTDRTIQKDLHELGDQVQEQIDNPGTVQLEMLAAFERLKERANDPDLSASARNRADELICNILGTRSAKAWNTNLQVREARIKEANAQIAEVKAEMAQMTLKRMKSVDDDNWRTGFKGVLETIQTTGAVGLKDVMALASTYLSASATVGSADNGKILSMIRILMRCAIVDPNASSPDLAIIRLPEGMTGFPPSPDLGDELMEH